MRFVCLFTVGAAVLFIVILHKKPVHQLSKAQSQPTGSDIINYSLVTWDDDHVVTVLMI